jgi:NADH-quinone oxidoreductase subunit N
MIGASLAAGIPVQDGTGFIPPTIEWDIIAPVVIVLGAAVIGVLVEAFVPRRSRRLVHLVLVPIALVAAMIAIVLSDGTFEVVMSGAYAADGPARFLQGVVLVVGAIGGLFLAERHVDPAGDAFAARASSVPGSDDERDFTTAGWLQTEIWPLFLFAIGGMMLFVAANDLLTMFVALEIMSLPLYLMTGMARRRRLLSQEAALKYFILGAFSSGFFIYGAALLYGFAGSVNLGDILDQLAAQPGENGLVLAGAAVLLVGLLFKVAAVPFHSWTPDVYQGAPTVVTGFMAAGVKVAAFGGLLRVMYVALAGVEWDLTPVLLVVASLTFIVGSVVALSQSDMKRMLAYSSIAHSGFLLLGVAAVSRSGLSATLFYLAAYAFATLGAFAIVSLVREPNGEATRLAHWAGLGQRSPLTAAAFALFLLAFAGIPLTSGFIGKFSVFAASVEAGDAPAVVLAVLASAVAAFFYARVIVLMFFSDPAAEGVRVVVPSVFTAIGLGATAAITVILGVFPQPLLDLANQADLFVR